jgi:hypothetical protein
MSELPIFVNGFSALAVRNDVIHSAVVQRVYLVLAQLTHRRLVIQVFSELEIEEPRLDQCARNDSVEYR